MRAMAKRTVPMEERPEEFREMCDRLNATMERLGLSGRRLAELSGVDRRTIDRFSKGERLPDVPNLLALAKGLGVAPWWLLTGDGEEEAAPGHLAQALPGFLLELQESGLATWAARQRGADVPSIAEALRALRDFEAARANGRPFYVNEGERNVRWGEYFANARAGKAMPVAPVASRRRTMDEAEERARVPETGLTLVRPANQPSKGS